MPCDALVVAGDDLHLDAGARQRGDRVRSVGTWRIEEGDETFERQVRFVLGIRPRERCRKLASGDGEHAKAALSQSLETSDRCGYVERRDAGSALAANHPVRAAREHVLRRTLDDQQGL